MKRLLVSLGAALLLGGCASSSSDSLAPNTVSSVDLKRYQGTWYELARLPMFFQRNCAQSEAHYSLKLWVEFDNWVSTLLPGVTKGDYWVLYLGDNYSTALVGNPDRKYLWLLSRKPQVDQQTRDELLSKAQQQGYDTTRLIWRTPDADMPKGAK